MELWDEIVRGIPQFNMRTQAITERYTQLIDSCSFLHPDIREIAYSRLRYCWEAIPGRLAIMLASRDRLPLDIARKTWAIAEFMRRMTTTPKDPPLVILLMLDLPKKWNGVASTKDINSGTYFRREHAILIWRLEEYYKVLIHEHVHAYEWDRIPIRHLPSYVIPLASGSIFAPQESITETITILFAAHLNQLMSSKDILKEQIRWSTTQAAYLWKNLPRDSTGGIIQDTDVVSYYISKVFWLWDLYPGRKTAPWMTGVFLQNTTLGQRYKGQVLDARKLAFRPPPSSHHKKEFSLRMSMTGVLSALERVGFPPEDLRDG